MSFDIIFEKCHQTSAKAPLTSPVTTPIVTAQGTRLVTRTTQVSTRSDEPKTNGTLKPSVFVKSPIVKPDDGLKAQQRGKVPNIDYPFRNEKMS